MDPESSTYAFYENIGKQYKANFNRNSKGITNFSKWTIPIMGICFVIMFLYSSVDNKVCGRIDKEDDDCVDTTKSKCDEKCYPYRMLSIFPGAVAGITILAFLIFMLNNFIYQNMSDFAVGWQVQVVYPSLN